jgi:nitric oxide dioxygenase
MPITEEQKLIVKATIPILETGGEILTKHFYSIILAENPEVVPFFNPTHQTSGDQPRALAHAVLMYAKNIDRLENLGPLASKIVNKHVSLGVRPEHYPIVGKYLLRSIREVLGPETATDAVIDAWLAAYTQLADILIAAEEGAYKSLEDSEGGWRNFRPFTLVRKVQESDEIISFYFVPNDQGKVIAHKPGQFTCIRTIINGVELRRNYSLSQVANGREFRISVKREVGGIMSNHLHGLSIGAEVEFLPPAGDFVYVDVDRISEPARAEAPVVIIAGGIGITPLLAITHQILTTTSRSIIFIHSARTCKVQAFREELGELVAQYSESRLKVHNWYTQEEE